MRTPTLKKLALAFFLSAQTLVATAQPVQLGKSHHLDIASDNNYAVVALNRIFHPKVMEIADWVAGNKAGIDAPKQYFTEIPIFYKEEGKSTWYLVSDQAVLQVALVENPQATAKGEMGEFQGAKIYWNILPRPKPSGNAISFDTEKAIRYLIKGAIFELTDQKGAVKAQLAQAKGNLDPVVDSLTQEVTKAAPTVITQVEMAVELEPNWLRNLMSKLVQMAAANKLNPQLGSQGVGQLKVDQTKNIIL